MSVERALAAGLEICAEVPGPGDREEKLLAFMRASGLSVSDILTALRDAAYCAQDVALGGGSRTDMFNGTTHDDLGHVAAKLTEARATILGR